MTNKNEFVYEFLYNPCIHESTSCTMSIHRTKKGAYKALRKFLLEKYDEWYNSADRKHSKWTSYESWGVCEIKLEE